MSLGLPIGPALEQLREVVSILRELGNAGPRDQSFKQWRQVSVTLLQRIWPNDQAKAARFRRIPFSPPSSRADTRTIRECYERGVCEAIAYLDSLIEELERDGRVGRPLVRPPEAPLADAEIAPDTYGAEPPFAPEPAPLDPATRETYALPPARPAASSPAAAAPPPAHLDHSGRDSYLVSAGHPEATAPRPAAPAPPPAQAPRLARDKAPKLGRTKQRLKDMLGFGDETPEPAPRPAASLPPPPAPAPPRPVAPPQPVAPPRPVAAAPPPPPPPPPVAVAPPPPAPSPAAPAQRFAFKRFEPPPPPPPPAIEEPQELPQELEDEPVDPSAEWSAPVHPLPGSKVVVGRPEPAPVPHPAADAYLQEDPEEGVDFDFDPEGGMEVDSEPPPATLREMLDRVPVQRAAVPPPAVRELFSLAHAVDQLGVPRERRALVRAALSDLGQQMETSQVEWSAIRQTMAFVLDYPLLARRVIPLLLPYLDEAA